MTLTDLSPLKKLYRLWGPIYPYLIRQITEIYGRSNGAILEMGPFSGSIFTLQNQGIGDSFTIAAFPAGMADFFRKETVQRTVDHAIGVIESDYSLTGIEEDSIDLVIFRGALFFPALFQVDFPAIFRVLKENGVAFIGGGFGKLTPHEVIAGIAKRSRELNLQAGKVEVPEGEIRNRVRSGLVPGKTEIISEGGLWIIMRKKAS